MQELCLSDNQLCSLPTTIGNLINLKYLNLDNNQLCSLPTTIDNLINLQYFNLFNNKLTNVPAEILNIKNIININETSYEINNFDIDCQILIFSKLNKNIENLSINIKEIWLSDKIKNPDIKLPFGCKIKYYETQSSIDMRIFTIWDDLLIK